MTTAALVVASAPFAAAQTDDPVAVVASIKPIHSLVAGVMGDLGVPGLIVQGGGSPHSYSMRPSDASALEQARVVFWVGEGLETFLAGTLEALARDAAIIELGEAPGVQLLAPRSGATWEAHVHDEDHGHEDHGHDDDHTHDDDHGHDDHGHDDHGHDDHGHDDDHGHGHAHGSGAYDAHIWLDPANAQAMVESIVAALSAADPAHAATYADNGAATIARIDALSEEMAEMLSPVQDQPFIVFHDAYQYLERSFALNAAGAITVSPDIQPGAARLQELRDRIETLGAVCVFSEPQFESALVATVIEGTEARTAVLDPLGADLADGPDLYFALMRRNAEALRDCLAG
ncbi:MAG: zinc ABC transporter substrate-binding protein [Alphaproteobacteria bacterium]